MKKILILAAIVAMPLAAFAQGRVNFANAGFAINTNSTSLGGAVGLATRNTTPLRVGLFVGADPGSLLLALNTVGNAPAWATNQNAPFAGAFNGGNNFGIAGNAGATIAFQIRAWSIAYTTYEEAEAAWLLATPGVFIGSSAVGSVAPATGAAPTPNLFGAGPGQVAAFQVIPNGVPEPSSIALGLLGLGAIALFRRRK